MRATTLRCFEDLSDILLVFRLYYASYKVQYQHFAKLKFTKNNLLGICLRRKSDLNHAAEKRYDICKIYTW